MTAQLNARGDVAVLVPAAGAGLRLGPGGPKALRLLAGEPLLVHAIRRVAAAPSVRQIVVAAPAADVSAVRSLLAPIAPVTVVAGGAERQESVAIALAQVPPEIEIVLVHDAARALTPPDLIEAVAAAVRSGAPAVIPVLPVVDTIKEVGPSASGPGGSGSSGSESGGSGSGGSGSGGSGSGGSGSGGSGSGGSGSSGSKSSASGSGGSESSGSGSGASGSGGSESSGSESGGSGSGGSESGASGSSGSESGGFGPREIVLGTVDRAALRSVQTPQGFRHHVLAAAHAAATDPLTDDAGLVEKAGLPVTCIPGSELALKITRPLDLILAEALLHLA